MPGYVMAAAFSLLGLFLTYQALRLPFRSLDGGPGPGLLPTGLGVLLLILAGFALVQSRHERVAFGNLRRIGIMVGSVALYAATLEWLGFVLATAIMVVALLLTFNERRRAPLAALGVAGTLATYALFSGALKVPLPADPWGLWR